MKTLYKNHTRNALLTTAIGMSMAVGAQAAPDPYAQEDMSWISISGEVKNITPDTFLLDYENGSVTVEMDDFDSDADAYRLVAGDNVTVFGRIDDDMFETTTIEASSVWVKGLKTYFYANSADEEDLPPEVTLSPADGDIKVTGKIHKIEGSEFTIDTGTRHMRVETAELSYNPFDDEGYQKLVIGDRVTVSGELDVGTWEKRELMADYIISLNDASSSGS